MQPHREEVKGGLSRGAFPHPAESRGRKEHKVTPNGSLNKFREYSRAIIFFRFEGLLLHVKETDISILICPARTYIYIYIYRVCRAIPRFLTARSGRFPNSFPVDNSFRADLFYKLIQ